MIIHQLVHSYNMHLSCLIFCPPTLASKSRSQGFVEGNEVRGVQGSVTDTILLLLNALVSLTQDRQAQKDVVSEYQKYFHGEGKT